MTAVALGMTIVTISTVLVVATLSAGVAVLLSLLLGGLYGSLFFLGHEAGHGSIVRRRHLQDALMWIAFAIFVLPPTLWRVWHNQVHHVHTNRPDGDPDNFGTLTVYRRFRSVRVAAAFTPGSGRWLSVLYLSTWFTVHSQIVLWVQSRRCRGFESLNRARAIAEFVLMAAFWIGLASAIDARSAMLVIVVPMLVANTIIMSYIVTNHLLRPLDDGADVLATSMSVLTHRWLDAVHFNFSHHVEHHFFPAMSPRYAPLVRARLREHAGDRFVVPPHLHALRLVFRTPRIHDDGALVDPARGRSVAFAEIDQALARAR
ncbi:MAG: fatty acid desaturase [Candidatus Rokubacteria bacterium]|nr:fatty acid desaturase [Candidatus Rokubacteria bacterium]